MAAECDILIENFKVGGLKRYGLDYQSIRKINPRLIYCSITGFGQQGPYAQRAGYDFLIQGMGGLMSLTGRKRRRAGRRTSEGRRRDDRYSDRIVREVGILCQPR